MTARTSQRIKTVELANINLVAELSEIGQGRMLKSLDWLKSRKPHPMLRVLLESYKLAHQWLQGTPSMKEVYEEDDLWSEFSLKLLGYRFAKKGMAEYFVRYLETMILAKQAGESANDDNSFIPAFYGYLEYLEWLLTPKGGVQKRLAYVIFSKLGLAGLKDLEDARKVAETYFEESLTDQRVRAAIGNLD